MRVRASDPTVVPELVDFLRENHCTVLRLDGDVLAVGIPKSLGEDALREELDRYLSAWNARRPAAAARRLDDG